MDCHSKNGHDHAEQLAKRSEQTPSRNEQNSSSPKGGRLDWETNQFKLEAVVTKNGAIAPQPVQLTTDTLFSAPMLSMGRKRVTGVKMLREISRGAPKANRPRIENIIKLYEKTKSQTSKRRKPS